MSTPKKSYGDKLRDPRWQKKRLSVLERDKYTCRMCGDTTTELHVHHKKYSGNPWDVDNDSLTTYCCHCHAAVENLKKMNVGIQPIRAKKVKGHSHNVLAIHGTNGGLHVAYLFLLADNGVEWLFTMQVNTINEIHALVHQNNIETPEIEPLPLPSGMQSQKMIDDPNFQKCAPKTFAALLKSRQR